jgi:hypothetical protein
MPLSNETVINKALSGEELKKLLAADFVDRLLPNEGMLSPHIAFGRVSYTIILALHLDNPFHPQSTVEVSSHAMSPGQLGEGVLEPPPLRDPSPDAVIAGAQLDRTITSPNAERVRNGMPITLDVKQPDGTVSQQHVSYPKDESLGEGDVKIEDVTPATKSRWRL